MNFITYDYNILLDNNWILKNDFPNLKSIYTNTNIFKKIVMDYFLTYGKKN